jgi:Tfp pilus assembly protein PilN
MSTINLLPEDYLRNRARKRANALCAILFAIVMAGVVAAGAVTDHNSRNTRDVCNQVNASYAEAAKLIEQVHQLQQQKATLAAKAEQASALQERVPRSYVLGTLTNACPDRASLLSVRLETKAATPEQMSKFDAVASQRTGKAPPVLVDLQITGQAATDVEVSQFITDLRSNPLLANVALNYSEEKAAADKTLIREFQVKMEIKPGVDVLDVIAPPAGKGAAPPKVLARRGDQP